MKNITALIAPIIFIFACAQEKEQAAKQTTNHQSSWELKEKTYLATACSQAGFGTIELCSCFAEEFSLGKTSFSELFESSKEPIKFEEAYNRHSKDINKAFEVCFSDENEGDGHEEESSEINEENQNQKTITISKLEFLEYPAVWLNPSNGKIEAVIDSPKPQSDGYMIWIEPQDPEFDFDKDWWSEFGGEYGLKYIGSGKENFNNKSIKEAISQNKQAFEQDLLYQFGRSGRKEGLEKMTAEKSIFYISVPDGECAIMITDYYKVDKETGKRTKKKTKRRNMEFEWMKIEKEEE